MKKGWQIIIAAVSIMILLGGICMGVGFITGAEFDRIYTVVDNRLNITVYTEWVKEEVIDGYLPSLKEAWDDSAPTESAPVSDSVPGDGTAAPGSEG